MSLRDKDYELAVTLGVIDENAKVVCIKVGSRGNLNTVPVNFDDKRKSSVLIHNHPSGQLTPSSADLGLASECSENGQGFYIINNKVSEIYVVMEPVKPKIIKKIKLKPQNIWL